MPATVKIRTDFSASELRRLAAGSKDANQSRRLLSLAAVLNGMGWADAARIVRRCATGLTVSTPTGPGRVEGHPLKGPAAVALGRATRRLIRDRRNGARPRKRRRYADTEAMQTHIDEISRRVARGAHAVVLLDRAGLHTTANLRPPKNMTLIFLPARSPELNPVENVRQYLRANWLSNRVFETYDDIIDAACEAWNKLTAAPAVITSIGMRQWAHIGYS